jgi:phosphoserine phosphatase
VREHGTAGHTTVLLGESFTSCLVPIMELCGADLMACAELGIRNGCYTGELSRPMDRRAKTAAVRSMLDGAGASGSESFFYGSDQSDPDLVKHVGARRLIS